MPAFNSDAGEGKPGDKICHSNEYYTESRGGLEADKNDSLLHAPRLIRKMYETLLTLAGNVLPNSVLFIGCENSVTTEDVDVSTPLCVMESNADIDDARDDRMTRGLARDSAKKSRANYDRT